MSIADKLQYLVDSKEAIKDALIEKGANITDDTPLEDYSTAIDKLEVGGGNIVDYTDTVTALIERDSYREHDILIPNGVGTIDKGVFRDLKLKSLSVPYSLRTVQDEAFYRVKYNNIGSCYWNNVMYVGEFAFYECGFYSLDNFTSLEEVGRYAFCRNNDLQFVELPNAKILHEGCFSSCTSINTVNLPMVETIESIAFSSNAYGLSTVTLGSYITSIAYVNDDNGSSYGAFDNDNYNITNIYIDLPSDQTQLKVDETHFGAPSSTIYWNDGYYLDPYQTANM